MRKRILAAALSLCLVLSLLPTVAFAADDLPEFAKSEMYEGEYAISSEQTLRLLADEVNAGNSMEGVKFYLQNDIVFNDGDFSLQGRVLYYTPSGSETAYEVDTKNASYGENQRLNWFVPIGFQKVKSSNTEMWEKNFFSGEFYGNQHTIKGLFVDNNAQDADSEAHYKALFGAISETAKVCDLTVSGGIYCTGSNAAGIAGKSFGIISNCSFYGAVLGGYNAGSMVGDTSNGPEDAPNSILNCKNFADISGSNGNVGGMVGCANNSSIIKCVNYGNIGTSTDSNVGGINGVGNAAVTNCVNYGTVTGGNSASTGGITGVRNSGAGERYGNYICVPTEQELGKYTNKTCQALYGSVLWLNDGELVDGMFPPVKEGVAFAGWYENEDFSGSAVTELQAEKIYYAKWASTSGTCGAADNENNVTWELTANKEDTSTYTLTISGTGDMASWEDAARDTRPWAFASDRITSVVVKDDITNIGQNAFFGLTALKTATLGQDIKTIERNAFRKCTSLTAFTIPDSVTSLGNNVLCECVNIAQLNIGSGLTNLGDCLLDCGQGNIPNTVLGKVIIPENIKNITNCSFRNCTNAILLIKGKEVTASGTTNGISGVKAVDATACTSFTFGGNIYGSAIVYVKNADVIQNLDVVNSSLKVAVTNGGTFAANEQFDTLATPVKEDSVFAGWYDNADFTGEKVTTPVAGQTYYAKWQEAVAQVGAQGYETLEEAITAAKAGNTVKLLADTRENVTISKALTLDLNGHTLNGGTVAGKPALTINNSSVTIQDSSEAQTGTIMREDTAENSGKTSHYVIDIQGKNGFLKFEGGNVKNNSGTEDHAKGASLIRLGDDSVSGAYPTLTINGGTFQQDNFVAIKVDRGTLWFKGGKVTSANSYAIENWNNANITGGTVNGTVASWVYSTGAAFSQIKISGGTVNGNVCAVNYDNAADKIAKVFITGGEITGTLGLYGYDNGLVPIADENTALIEVSGGTFTKDPSAYLAEGVELNTNDNGSYTAEKTYLAKIGETSYYTMDEAFHAVKAGETITMLRNYTTNKAQNSGSKSFTIDLHGHTWTTTGLDTDSAAFEINYSDVTLTVKNGTVVSNSMVGLVPSAMSGTIKYDNSGLVFENVIMTANGHSGIESNGNNTNDTITLKNSTLNVPNGYGIYFPSSGTVTLENSKINAKTMGVQVCAGSLNVKDSEITVTGDPVEKTENDGAIEDGAAISIVDRAGYKGLGTITIESGKFTAKSGNDAVKAYGWNNTDKTETTFDNSKNTVTISGGTFSAAPNETLLADNLEAKLIGGVYQVQEKNTNAYEVVLVPDTQDVSAGDTITYTVKLVNKKDTASEIGFFRITPPVNDALLELTGGKATMEGVKYAKVADNTNFEFTYAGSKEALTLAGNGTLEIGTLTYKVKAYETDQTQVTVTVDPGSKDDQVSNPGYNESVNPEVKTEKDVVYHVIKVTFKQDEDNKETFYVPYGGSELYKDLDKLAGRKDTDKKSAPLWT